MTKNTLPSTIANQLISCFVTQLLYFLLLWFCGGKIALFAPTKSYYMGFEIMFFLMASPIPIYGAMTSAKILRQLKQRSTNSSSATPNSANLDYISRYQLHRTALLNFLGNLIPLACVVVFFAFLMFACSNPTAETFVDNISSILPANINDTSFFLLLSWSSTLSALSFTFATAVVMVINRRCFFPNSQQKPKSSS